MNHTKNLQHILEQQRNQVNVLESAIAALEREGLADENEKLRKQVEALSGQNSSLAKDAKDLRGLMNDYMFNERTRVLRVTKEQMEFYYKNAAEGADNKLSVMEQRYKQLLNGFGDAANLHIGETNLYFAETIKRLRVLHEQERQAIKAAMEAKMSDLEQEPLPSEEDLRKRLKFFNAEMRFGTKVLNILGVLLILLGVVFGLQYSFANIFVSPELRAATAYLLGILFLAGGEVLQRQTKFAVKPAFALGLAAGGIAILFASTAISYFVLQVLGMFAALGLCIGISIAAFLLAVRYSSRTIACFALVGGYLPMAAIIDSPEMALPAMFYFVILNSFALVLAIKRRWYIVNIFAFVLSVLSSAAFVGIGAGTLPMLLYLGVNFLLFLGMILIYPLRKGKTAFNTPDIVLLSANTVVSCLMIYTVLNLTEPFAYNGLLALGFFAVYFAGAKLCEKFSPGDRRIAGIFYITALIFSVLTVPMQLGLDWMTIGWTAIGTALTVYGILNSQKITHLAGWIVIWLAFLAFMLKLAVPITRLEFFVDYTWLNLCLIGILAAYFVKGRWNMPAVAVFRHFMTGQLLVYLLYAIDFVYRELTREALLENTLLFTIMVMAALIYGTAIKYIPHIKGKVTDIMSVCICAGAVLMVLLRNTSAAGHSRGGLVMLIVLNILSAAVVFDTVGTLQKFRKTPLEWLSVVTSAYALVLVNQMLMVQFWFEPTSVVISVIGMAAAFGWIVFGFVRRNRTMRLAGLVFSLVTLTKLFFFDLYFLTDTMRILSYFVFGVIFLGISFVYQYFSRRV